MFEARSAHLDRHCEARKRLVRQPSRRLDNIGCLSSPLNIHVFFSICSVSSGHSLQNILCRPFHSMRSRSRTLSRPFRAPSACTHVLRRTPPTRHKSRVRTLSGSAARFRPCWLISCSFLSAGCPRRCGPEQEAGVRHRQRTAQPRCGRHCGAVRLAREKEARQRRECGAACQEVSYKHRLCRTGAVCAQDRP
jgi:hypothetical protein